MKFSFKKRAMWPSKRKEVNKVLEAIEKHQTTFILAVAGDTLRTTLMTQADVGEIKKVIGTLKNDVSEVKSNVSVITAFVCNQRAKDVFKWLKTNDPSTNYAFARQKHESITSDWFNRSIVFIT